MGKKKRHQVFVLKPWCWYCEREFEDDKVLLQHQKSKHFKCQLCPRKLNTAGGLMVHSQQVHKCDPEPLTNTLPGRDGFDVEIFGMEGVPSNAQAEWKARKEAEAGAAALVAASTGQRPRHSYTVIPEADLTIALAQHKALMATRNKPVKSISTPMTQPPMVTAPNGAPIPFPMALPGMPPPTLPVGMPGFPPPPGFIPPFPMVVPPYPGIPGAGPVPTPPGAGTGVSPIPGPLRFTIDQAGTGNFTPIPGHTQPYPQTITPMQPGAQTPMPAAASATPAPAPSIAVNEIPTIQPPKDGVMWPDATASPAEKRAQQSRYRYTSPTPDGGEAAMAGRKRKAAADFL